MRKRILFALGFICMGLVISSCSKDEEEDTGIKASDLAGTWGMTNYCVTCLGFTECGSDPTGSEFTITFTAAGTYSTNEGETGTFTVSGDQISTTQTGKNETDTATISLNGNTLSYHTKSDQEIEGITVTCDENVVMTKQLVQ